MGPPSQAQGPEAKGQESVSLALSRSQKEGQTGIRGYRLGKLRPQKREGRERISSPSSRGLVLTPVVSGAGPPLSWMAIWWSGKMRNAVNRFGVKRRRPGLEFTACSSLCVRGQVFDLPEPSSHTCTTGHCCLKSVVLHSTCSETLRDAGSPALGFSHSLFRIWVWILGNLLLNVLLWSPTPTGV